MTYSSFWRIAILAIHAEVANKNAVIIVYMSHMILKNRDSHPIFQAELEVLDNTFIITLWILEFDATISFL